MWSRRALLACLPAAGLALSGCGFRPLYGRGDGQGLAAAAEFSSIIIPPIPDRSGQLLRNALRDRLTPRGVPANPRYRLDVTLNEQRSDLVILRDATSTFAKMRFSAAYALVDFESGKAVTQGRAESTTTFNIVESQFANISAESDARRRAADELAEDIRLRLGLHFHR